MTNWQTVLEIAGNTLGIVAAVVSVAAAVIEVRRNGKDRR
jgi:hypothetical protein